ncbi:hypothetical protein K450DRAFT_222682 [Umbelopsis ramanniana AG]|uniref:Cyclin-like domain-containing protein n=1 Tax=Umbelopsis ramanniana AG TaxID=1314678 RepID=A0AAD5HI27_UMBRA|nr:uncharacterized protein K450DRAFT_222682 [Umbelopsis ramanniana AG]KAI8583246.1 hypothetical protein K450DRAFT_222682 [Umbelopsis ramanniana AG]
MSTAHRTSRRETARQAAFTFLSNIALGSEVDRSQVRNDLSDSTDALSDPKSKNFANSRPLEANTSQISERSGNAIGTSFDGHSSLNSTHAAKRGPDLKVDTSRRENMDTLLRKQSSPGVQEDWSESPLDLRLRDAGQSANGGNKSLHSVDSSLSDGDIDDTALSRSGQLSGPASAVLTASETNATSLLSKQLESRPEAFINHNYGGPYGRRMKSDNFEDNDGHHHKLTREDNSKPIASEKIKKKHVEREQHTGLGILSAFRYYSDKIRQSAIKRRGEATSNTGYVQQQIANHDHQRRRPAQSFGHFLDPCGSLQPEEIVQEQLLPSAYDPYFLENELYSPDRIKPGGSSHGTSTQLRPADVKRELNEMFRSEHPEIPVEITLSKIRAIKLHLLEVGKELDLEVSSVAHAYVYFEKLVVKNIITKKNRKLIAGCCLFLAVKVNEPKGSRLQPLLDAIDDELDIDSEEILEHEFAVFADLEFNLYVPRREFMPHFERICCELELKSIEAYLGDLNFFAADTK